MSGEKIVEVKSLKPGRYILLDGEASKITSMSHSKPGKHGEAKVRIEGIGVFDNQKRSTIKPASHKVTIPVMDKRVAQVLSAIGDRIQLMDMESYETFEMPVPDDVEGELTEGVEVLYMEAMGNKKIIQKKT